jgi:predicted RNase H-like nuclease (RuvC/YqgF family)
LVSNKKHLEETSRLGGELIKTRHDNNKKVSELEKEIKRLEVELAETNKKLNDKSEKLRKAGKQSPRKISDTNKIKTLEKRVSELEEKLKEKDEYIEQLHEITSKKNGQKVGRKSKATDENIAEITRLHNEGYSYSQIAKIFTQTTGENISKSTVAKIAKVHFASTN